jgi:hypothetical protein
LRLALGAKKQFLLAKGNGGNKENIDKLLKPDNGKVGAFAVTTFTIDGVLVYLFCAPSPKKKNRISFSTV